MSFWVGIALAIPLAIVANLLTPKAQAYLDRRNTTKAALRRAAAERDEQEVRNLARNPEALKEEMLAALLRLAYIAALFGLLASVPSLAGVAMQSAPINYRVVNVLFIIGAAFGLIGTLTSLNIARRAL